ncbi:hypothetical protein G6031_12025 [Dietzia sp. CQ4]|uniref:hypothetical protein n=1 Tax=Dietzia sp. (strain CQ4) TaxID=370437 RepID=UPI0015FA9039|nr:hypothetical protein [Dietzia sp. CQ4]MBB1035103.1 hypothetical protein [Dietzia sp. CQ4]
MLISERLGMTHRLRRLESWLIDGRWIFGFIVVAIIAFMFFFDWYGLTAALIIGLVALAVSALIDVAADSSLWQRKEPPSDTLRLECADYVDGIDDWIKEMKKQTDDPRFERILKSAPAILASYYQYTARLRHEVSHADGLLKHRVSRMIERQLLQIDAGESNDGNMPIVGVHWLRRGILNSSLRISIDGLPVSPQSVRLTDLAMAQIMVLEMIEILGKNPDLPEGSTLKPWQVWPHLTIAIAEGRDFAIGVPEIVEERSLRRWIEGELARSGYSRAEHFGTWLRFLELYRPICVELTNSTMDHWNVEVEYISEPRTEDRGVSESARRLLGVHPKRVVEQMPSLLDARSVYFTYSIPSKMYLRSVGPPESSKPKDSERGSDDATSVRVVVERKSRESVGFSLCYPRASDYSRDGLKNSYESIKARFELSEVPPGLLGWTLVAAVYTFVVVVLSHRLFAASPDGLEGSGIAILVGAPAVLVTLLVARIHSDMISRASFNVLLVTVLTLGFCSVALALSAWLVVGRNSISIFNLDVWRLLEGGSIAIVFVVLMMIARRTIRYVCSSGHPAQVEHDLSLQSVKLSS